MCSTAEEGEGEEGEGEELGVRVWVWGDVPKYSVCLSLVSITDGHAL